MSVLPEREVDQSSLTCRSCNQAYLQWPLPFKSANKGFLTKSCIGREPCPEERWLTTLKFMGSILFPPLFCKACCCLLIVNISQPLCLPRIQNIWILLYLYCTLSQPLQRTSFKQGMKYHTIYLPMSGFNFYLTMGINDLSRL